MMLIPFLSSKNAEACLIQSIFDGIHFTKSVLISPANVPMWWDNICRGFFLGSEVSVCTLKIQEQERISICHTHSSVSATVRF